MNSKPVVPRKRPLDRSIVRRIEELRKRRTLVQAVRDFPPGCGTNNGYRRPLNVSKNMHSDPVETDKLNSSKPKELGMNKPSKVDDHKVMNTQSVKHSRIKSFEPKELGRNKSYLGSRSTPKVKYWDPLKEDEAQKSEIMTDVESRKDQVRREKIKEAMTMFDQVYGPLSEKNKLKPKGERASFWKVSIEATRIVKQRLKWKDPVKTLGPVCGVRIGDKFKYRSQLAMIGLHCQHQSGIDYTSIEGTNVAISVVDSRRYSNVSSSSDTLEYSGQGGGGTDFSGRILPLEDQKLINGNLALKNSSEKKNPVRVIKKIDKDDVFVYDGLYIVEKYTYDRNEQGNVVFKFHMKRVPGQPPLREVLNGSR